MERDNNNVWQSPKYNDGSYYTYSHGKKDDWYLLYYDSKGNSHKLFDKDYFNIVKFYSIKYGNNYVFKDFETVYDMVSELAKNHNSNPEPSLNDLNKIKLISAKYEQDCLPIDKLFGLLYLAMISEWHYVTSSGNPSILKHSLKKLGIYQVIFEGKDGEYAACYSKNKSAQELKKIMQEKSLI